MMQLLIEMLVVPWDSKHSCLDDEDVTNCGLCEVSALWYQLANQVMQFVVPLNELTIPSKDMPRVEELQHRQVSEHKGRERSK